MQKISLIMPIYNAEPYLEEALDSVISQTLSEIEIICINDGSTDNSLEIIKEYAAKDERIKIIDKPNEGYGKTINRGLDEAKGEFIAVFEPDDILDKTIYEKLYAIAEKENLDVVKCNFFNYWSEKNKKKKSGLVSRCAKKQPFCPKDSLKIFTAHASIWAGIYRKSFLDENNIRLLETAGASYQDMSFTFKVLATVDKMYLLDEALLYYRQDNPNSSVNNPKKMYCVCDEYEEIGKFLDNHPEKKEIFNTQKLINQYRAYLWNLKRLDKSLQKEFLSRFSSDFREFYQKGKINDVFFKSIKKSEFMDLINNSERFYSKGVNSKRANNRKVIRKKFRNFVSGLNMRPDPARRQSNERNS